MVALVALMALAPGKLLKAESTIEQLSPGTHVIGAPLNVPSLKGKVVVLELWGLQCPPCRALYPHMVSLAKSHKGRPLHIITSHAQSGSIDDIKNFVTSQGVVGDEPNLSVVNGANHPLVQTKGIPYYGIFNHKGEMVHAGRPDDLDAWVTKLLAETPNLYLGEEPFTKIGELAKQVESAKGLGSILGRLESILQDSSEEGAKPLSEADKALASDDTAKAECKRLHDILVGYADAKKNNALTLIGTNPSTLIAELNALEKEFSGSSYAAKGIAGTITEYKASAELKAAIKLDNESKSLLKSLERLKSCETCMRSGAKVFKSGCASCKEVNQKKIVDTCTKLEALIEGKDDLPIAKRIRDSISGFRS
ncbi:MAG: TlpA family protein disulfide reductase [Planctomycetota bacterium]